MLECHSCLLQCLRAIAGEAVQGARPALRTGLRSRPNGHRVNHTRGYATAPARFGTRYDFQQQQQDTVQPKTYTKEDGFIRRNKARKIESKPPTTKTKTTTAAVANTTTNDTDYTSTISPQLERAVKKELVYLKDPLKHANHVRQTLRANEFDKALALCRIASKDMQVIVSWNHTIDYLLARRELKLALKTYNEMKKRAQFPDSHTYVILLRGLAVPPVHGETVGKAVSIYHSLAAPNSRVVQSIIHTNAALKVCARGHDMDSLWGIASRIPDKGPGAADNFTFTTILNAIRENALLAAGPREDDDATLQARQTAIHEGRRIWEDVIGKWRKGDVVVDEELICAMGRLLLVGLRPRDWDDVLSLVEQTMNIPRLAAKLGTPARKAEHLPMPRVLKEDAEPNEDEEELLGEFDKELVRVPKKVGGRGSVAYVKPGNNTLSLLIEACLKMATPKIATEYWSLLTAEDGYGIVPDMENLNMYLRLLRQTRSSNRVVEVLRNDIFDKGLVPPRKTYRIAMSACNRDKTNPNAIKNAGAILDMMEKNQSELDVKAAQLYLDLCIGSQDGKTIAHALKRLGPVVQNLRSQLSWGSDRGANMNTQVRDDALLLFRTIIGAIDQLVSKSLVPAEENAGWVQRRARLAAYVARLQAHASGKDVFSPEAKTEMRRQSRQLRNLRRNTLRREKRTDGTWEQKKTKPTEEQEVKEEKKEKEEKKTENKKEKKTEDAVLSDTPTDI